MKQFSNISIIQKGGRIMLILISFLLVCIFIISGVLLVYSPGKTKPLLNEVENLLREAFQKKYLLISTE